MPFLKNIQNNINKTLIKEPIITTVFHGINNKQFLTDKAKQNESQ